MSYYTDEVYGESPLSSLARFNDDGLFEALMGQLPVCGSKIDWEVVKGSESWTYRDSSELLRLWSEILVPRLQVSSSVLHVGDYLSEFGVNIPSGSLQEIGPLILEVPEHHYFLSICGRVLVVITTEGYIDSVALDPPLVIADLGLASD